jgi:glycosyltransferase involved in cell wall biosynthesis
VRNEAAHIEVVARAVAAQTRPPDLWLVVDDGSRDATPAKLLALQAQIPFLRVLATPPGFTVANGDRLAAAAAPRAFNFGLRAVYADAFDFIGKLDGDTELTPTYLERLLERFERAPGLGIGGGTRVKQPGAPWHEPTVPATHVPGALKLYRRACLQDIGGIQERLAWDAIDETYARMRGYEVRSFGDLVAIHHREFGTADGQLRGRRRLGASAYVACHAPWWVLGRSLKVARERPRGLSGLAFLAGYVQAGLGPTARVQDADFRRFVRREQRQRLTRS